MERILEGEMTAHLGYERGERSSSARENTRNGTSSKGLKTDRREIRLDVPRDRGASFEPKIVRKHQTRNKGFDEAVRVRHQGSVTRRSLYFAIGVNLPRSRGRMILHGWSSLPRPLDACGASMRV